MALVAVKAQNSDGDEMEIGGGAAVVKDNGVRDISCTICKRMYSQAKLVNAGDKQYPSWRDKNCHAAIRALERAAQSKGALGQSKLSNLRKHKPDTFKRLVCMYRADMEGDKPCQYDHDPSMLEGEGMAKATESVASEIATNKVHRPKHGVDTLGSALFRVEIGPFSWGIGFSSSPKVRSLKLPPHH